MNTRYTVSPHLQEVLDRRERSASWLARKIGISRSLISKAMLGERTLSADKVFLAAGILGEPVEYLFVATEQNNMSTERAIA